MSAHRSTTASRSRTTVLCESLEKIQAVVADLKLIDLRTVRGPLRDHVKIARELADSLQDTLFSSIQSDAADLRSGLAKAG